MCSAYAWLVKLNTQPVLLKYRDSCGIVHHVKFWGPGPELAKNIKPKIQRRHLFADLAINYPGSGIMDAISSSWGYRGRGKGVMCDGGGGGLEWGGRGW
jgi:hypothetical protein